MSPRQVTPRSRRVRSRRVTPAGIWRHLEHSIVDLARWENARPAGRRGSLRADKPCSGGAMDGRRRPSTHRGDPRRRLRRGRAASDRSLPAGRSARPIGGGHHHRRAKSSCWRSRRAGPDVGLRATQVPPGGRTATVATCWAFVISEGAGTELACSGGGSLRDLGNPGGVPLIVRQGLLRRQPEGPDGTAHNDKGAGQTAFAIHSMCWNPPCAGPLWHGRGTPRRVLPGSSPVVSPIALALPSKTDRHR